MSVWGHSHQSYHSCSTKFRVPVMSMKPFSLRSYFIVVCDGIRASLEGPHSYEVLAWYWVGWTARAARQHDTEMWIIREKGPQTFAGILQDLGPVATPWLAIPHQLPVMLRRVSPPVDSAQYAEQVHA